MSVPSLRIDSVYQPDLRTSGTGVEEFAPPRDPSRFIRISSPLSSWSNKGEMQI
jgi:hypothetical protein